MRKTICSIILVLFGISSAYGSEPSLKLTIKADKPLYYAGDPVMVFYQLENISEKPVKILAWGGVFDLEKQYVNLFEIKDALGKERTWKGPDVNFPLPTKKDYITMEPGETLKNTYTLNLFYDVITPGSYLAECNKAVFGVISNKIKIEILGRDKA